MKYLFVTAAFCAAGCLTVCTCTGQNLVSLSQPPQYICACLPQFPSQTMHAICKAGGLNKLITDPPYLLAAYLAAIIHDHEHPGKN